MSEYEPGTVAVATVRGVPNVRVFRYSEVSWVSSEPVKHTLVHHEVEGHVTDVRPLVVLDPEDREQVERLASACRAAFGWRTGADENDVTQTQVALRSLTRPPKPDEPKGRYAEVEDGDGYVWFRDPVGSWRRVDSPGNYVCHMWESVPAVRVLSEGVQP